MFERLKSVVRSPTSEDVESAPAGAASDSASTTEDNIRVLNGLSWELKIQCFVLCFILSMICSFLGSPLLFAGNFSGFAVMVSVGSFISLAGTCFLTGPLKQLKKMFEPTRLLASLTYILMIALTLIAGLVLQNPGLALIFTGGQYIAMAWYSLSYIPYARETLLSCFGRFVSL